MKKPIVQPAPGPHTVMESVKMLRNRFAHPIRAVMILGSGLGSLTEMLPQSERIAYSEIPGFPPVTVEGHGGELVLSEFSPGFSIACMRGRFHCYEGLTPAEVTYPLQVFKQLGAESLIVTNAAGGIRPDLAAGDLMLINDQINFTGLNPLTGCNDDTLGPRFPAMSDAYNQRLQALALQAGHRLDMHLKTGVYIGVNGPSYETPAEIRMMRGFGADAVGMSTVLEVIAANHMGLNVLGLSCITNATPDGPAQALSHTEVIETAERVKPQFIRLLQEILTLLSSQYAGQTLSHAPAEGVAGR